MNAFITHSAIYIKRLQSLNLVVKMTVYGCSSSVGVQALLV